MTHILCDGRQDCGADGQFTSRLYVGDDERGFLNGFARFTACVMVVKYDLRSMLVGLMLHKYRCCSREQITPQLTDQKEGFTLV